MNRFYSFLILLATGLLPLQGASTKPPLSSAEAQSQLTDKILQLAQAYIGADKAPALQTLQLSGRGEDLVEKVSFKFAMKVKKPCKQRLQMWTGDKEMTVITNGTEGFKFFNSTADQPSKLYFLSGAELNSLVISTLENLYFYDGVKNRFGTLTGEGPLDWNGQKVFKLTSVYSPSVYYERFLDATTGKLLFTRNETGLEDFEEGSIWVNGLHFPQKVSIYSAGELVRTMEFEAILVNEPLDDSLFEEPTS